MLEEIKVVIADIDMTLTAKGGELPEITKEAFEILHRNDVRIGLGTGREINQALRKMGKKWGLSFEFDFVVGMNGGMILDHRNNNLLPIFHDLTIIIYKRNICKKDRATIAALPSLRWTY